METRWYDKVWNEKYSVRHPLDGDPPEFSKLFQHKGITYEKVAHAILVDSFSPVPDQVCPESSRWFVNSLSFGDNNRSSLQ